MADIQTKTDNPNIEEVKNARIGYQVATNLWSSRADELWSQFSSIMTANSIVLAASTFAISNPNSPAILSIGMPIVGLFLCVLWLLLHTRGSGYTIYWAQSARELEEKYLNNSLNILSRGSHFSEGEKIELLINNNSKVLRMKFIGRIIRVEWVAYTVIFVFASMYIGILFWK